MASLSGIWQRQQGGSGNGGLDNSNSDPESDWWSPEWRAIRYTIVVLLLAAFVLFFVGGYWHARRRVRAGLAPLPYHAFLVRRNRQPQARPYYGPGPGRYGYPMQDQDAYQAPPPPYVPPPVYQPPDGASKVMADQHFTEVHGSANSDAIPSVAAPSASRQQ